jgi:hypothetical protein
MLDDLCDLSSYEKVLTLYFTMCTIVSYIILLCLGLLESHLRILYDFYTKKTLFYPLEMLDDLCDLSSYEKVLTLYFTMCTIMSNIILQSFRLLVALMNFI